MGAVLLDPTMRKCLLVRGFSQQASWGFPRGKVAKGESDASCAIREVRLQTLCGLMLMGACSAVSACCCSSGKLLPSQMYSRVTD